MILCFSLKMEFLQEDMLLQQDLNMIYYKKNLETHYQTIKVYGTNTDQLQIRKMHLRKIQIGILTQQRRKQHLVSFLEQSKKMKGVNWLKVHIMSTHRSLWMLEMNLNFGLPAQKQMKQDIGKKEILKLLLNLRLMKQNTMKEKNISLLKRKVVDIQVKYKKKQVEVCFLK